MRKSIKIRVMCLIVAGVMLTGSLLVAAVAGSPYETLRNAIFDAMFYENVTMDAKVSVSFNGVPEEIERTRLVVGDTGTLEYFFDIYGNPTGGFWYSTDGLTINSNAFTDADGTIWYSAWVSPWSTAGRGPFYMGPMEERGSARFRFMELLLDLFVGDLKNHMTMSTSGGVRSVTGTITHNQLPEIIRVGLDVIIEDSQRWHNFDMQREDFSNPMHIPMQSIHFNRIHGDADIDANGNLTHLSGHVDMTVTNIFGDVNTIDVAFELNFSNIGTSGLESPIPGAAELFTTEFMEEHFGARHSMTVYFTRNADGTINEESITTTWPGQGGDRNRRW